MALIESVEFISKKGRRFVIRNPDANDAEKLLKSFIEITKFSPFILTTLESVQKMSVDDERKFIVSNNEGERKVLLIAEVDGQIAGIANFFGYADNKRKHRGALGISLHPDFRNEGIAKKLMEVGIDFVRALPGFRFLELEVFSSNHDAIKLYEKLGFKTLHITPNASIQPDGSEHDELKMRFEVCS